MIYIQWVIGLFQSIFYNYFHGHECTHPYSSHYIHMFLWFSLRKKKKKNSRWAVTLWFFPWFSHPRCSMVLEYLPTFTSKKCPNLGKYSGIMEHLGHVFFWFSYGFSVMGFPRERTLSRIRSTCGSRTTPAMCIATLPWRRSVQNLA